MTVDLPSHPGPVGVSSADKKIVVEVNDWGQPLGVQLEDAALDLGGAELAARIIALYEVAKAIALAVRNVEHHRQTGQWVPIWPTPTHVAALRNQLHF